MQNRQEENIEREINKFRLGLNLMDAALDNC